MIDKKGLQGIWEDIESYLSVDVDVSHNVSPEAQYPAILRFQVTNTATAQEDQPEIVYEEVNLSVGVPPNWHVKKVENFRGDQSFSYDHPCNYADIAKIQWTVEGRVSPTFLLHFRQRPKIVPEKGQLPIKAYFDYLDKLNIHRWLEGTIKCMAAPGSDTTLCEMKAEENLLESIVGEIRNTPQEIQDFLGYVDYKKYSHDIVQHKHRVEEYLNRIEKGIIDLLQILKTQRAEEFDGTREKIITNLYNKAAELDNATTAIKQKVGILEVDINSKDSAITNQKVQPPQPIPLREIDLHGNTAEEAIPLINEFLKNCYEDNVREVKIIHGKGIGVLRKNTREPTK